jgi:hypothetical protein
MSMNRVPVSADDVDTAVRLAIAALSQPLPEGADWNDKAAGLEWTCWETVEHLADDLFSYAAQLGPRPAPQEREVRFAWARKYPGGPANAIYADPEGGPAGLMQMLDACGALLTAMVRTTPADVRSHHVYGLSDAEGFAAMGVVETLVHTHDAASGLGIEWDPPRDLCERVLARLFRDVPADADRWHALLWATGRAELPGRPRLTTWRWYGEPASG